MKQTIPTLAIEAAAKIGEHHAGVFQSGGCREHFHEDSFECVARLMLEAAAPYIHQPSRADIARVVLEHWPQEYLDPRYPSAFRCAADGCAWRGRFAGDISEHVADLIVAMPLVRQIAEDQYNRFQTVLEEAQRGIMTSADAKGTLCQ